MISTLQAPEMGWTWWTPSGHTRKEKVVPKKKKSAGKASKQKTVEIEKTGKDKELEGLLEDADIIVPILVTPSADTPC